MAVLCSDLCLPYLDDDSIFYQDIVADLRKGLSVADLGGGGGGKGGANAPPFCPAL